MKHIYPLLILILILGCIQDAKKKEDQLILFSDNNDSLINIIMNYPEVMYCNEPHYHFVDIVAKQHINSLIGNGIDTLLFYRDWLGTNGFNGYGITLWKKNNINNMLQYNFENRKGKYGISSIDTIINSDLDAIDFFIKNRIDTVASNLKENEWAISHDSSHFIYMSINGNETCFHVPGLNLRFDSTHLKSTLINKLTFKGEYYNYLDSKEN